MKSGRKESYLQAALYLLWFVLDPVGANSLTRTNTSAPEWKGIFENDHVFHLLDWMQNNCTSDEAVTRPDNSTSGPADCTCSLPYYNIWCACQLIEDKDIDNISWNNSCNQTDILTTDLAHRADAKIPSWAYIAIDNGTCNFAIIKDILDALHPKWTVTQILTPVLVFLVTVLLFGTIALAWRQRRKILSLLASFCNLFKGRAPGVIHQIPHRTWVIDGPRGPADNDAESVISMPLTPLISSSMHEISHWSASTSEINPPPQSRVSSDRGMLGASTLRGLGKRVNDLLSWFGAWSSLNNNVRMERDNSRRSSYVKSPSSITKEGYSEIENGCSIIVIGNTPDQSSDSNHQLRPPQGVGTVGDAVANPKSPSINVSLEPPSPSEEYVPVRSPPIIPKSPGPAPQERPPSPPNITHTRQASPPRIRISTQLDGPPVDVSSNHVSDEYTNLSYATVGGISQKLSQTFLDTRSTNGSPTGNTPGTEQYPGLRLLPSRPAKSPGPTPAVPLLMHHKSDTAITVPHGAMAVIRGSSSIDDVQSVSRQRGFDPYTTPGVPNSLQPNRPHHAVSRRPYIRDHQVTASNTSLLRETGDSSGYPQRGWSADDDMSLLNHSPVEVEDSMDGSRGVYIAPLRDAETLPSRSARSGVVSVENLPTFSNDVGVTENSPSGTGGEEFSPQSPTLSMYQADGGLQRASYVGIQSYSEPSGWDDSTQSTHGPRPKPFAPQPGPSLAHANRSREDVLNHDPGRVFSGGHEPAAGRMTELGLRSVLVPVPSRSPTPRPSADAAIVLGSGDRPLSRHETNNVINDVREVTSSRVFGGYVSNRAKTTSGGTWGTDSSGVQSVYESTQAPLDVHKAFFSQGPRRMP